MEMMYWVIFCLAFAATLWEQTIAVDPSNCPETYDIHPVLVISMDGFRADYLQRGLTPTIQGLADLGISVPFMKPTYPTETFPNHYSIVTGLYPESHGIISNKFYDPVFQATFSLSSEEATKGRWWGGEPIWNTVTRQGKLSATYFWPGSDADIGGKHPTYWVPYSDDTPFPERVDQVIEWISLPKEERPSWISLYFNEPDHTAHSEGPDSPLVNDQLVYVDLMIERLLEGLANRGLASCVNILLLADHGMAAGSADTVIKLVDYIPDIYDTAYTFTGAFARIDPKDESEEVEIEMLEKLVCQRDDLRAYRREDLPTRFHFNNNRRIEDIVLDLDAGFRASVSSSFYLKGNHGYDNYDKEMNALFIAYGPEFKDELEVEPFQNIELYNLMCHLVGVEPSPNNGTLGSLYHILADPPLPPMLPQEEEPPTAIYPDGDIGPLLGMSGCEGDLTSAEDWLTALDLSEEEQQEAKKQHLPWGIPYSGELPASLTLLYHNDHVTGYSEAIQMPLWTSFTLDGGPPPGTSEAQWSSDVRLQPETTATCASYNHLQDVAHMAPLFPPAYSRNSSLERVPYLVSNSVPQSKQMENRWREVVEELVPSWLTLLRPLNLVFGPVFDNDADSHVDNFTNFSTPEIPSDLFAVVTRCLIPVTSLDLCPPEYLDALTLIYPELQGVPPNCMTKERYAQEFSSEVKDVEMATGLTFYPDLSFEDRTRITLRIHSDIWPLA